MISRKTPNSDGLHCHLEDLSVEPFLSLVDYRNNYFTSDDPDKIIEFYNGFNTRRELLSWMEERPRGVPIIHEVEGDKEIVVVIPTADFNGKYARECRENVFKGLQIVFISSSGKRDFYFNFANYVNVGIRRAMEYSPKWIIYSGDDRYKIDEISKLKSSLSEIDYNLCDVVFTKPAKYHSRPYAVVKTNFLYKIFRYFFQFPYGREFLKIEKKYNIRYIYVKRNFIHRLAFGEGYDVLMTQSFGIFSSNMIRKLGGKLFDEIFINESEDADLSMRLSLDFRKVSFIDYRIGDFVGVTLGNGLPRKLRSLASRSYFESKWEKLLK